MDGRMNIPYRRRINPLTLPLCSRVRLPARDDRGFRRDIQPTVKEPYS